MILAIDVDYRKKGATVSGAIFETGESEKVVDQYTLVIDQVAEYMPGNFYKRELLYLTSLLGQIRYPITCIVIDGYVYLGAKKLPGLGKRLWDELNGEIPVIGMAKSSFKDTPHQTRLFRGSSAKPLYITAEGIDLKVAKMNIFKMKGHYRIPTLLKYVDTLCRSSH